MKTDIKVERKVRSSLQDYRSVWELSVGEFQVDTVDTVGPIFALSSVASWPV